MTRDERIEDIRRASNTAEFTRADWDVVRFLLAELDAAKEKLADYEMAAKYPGDDQRHRGASVASQLVHAQHMREQVEAERDEALAHNAKLTERVQRLTDALTTIGWYTSRESWGEAVSSMSAIARAALAEGEPHE